MEAHRFRTIIMELQNIIVKKLQENNLVFMNDVFIQELYDFHQAVNGYGVPSYFYIDPFTFNTCFYSDHYDISFSGDTYWYKGGVEIIFSPKYFGFFNNIIN